MHNRIQLTFIQECHNIFALANIFPSLGISQPAAMAALEAADGAVTGTTITVATHEPAIAAPVMGCNTTATDAEAEAVGVHFDRLDSFEQHFVDNILEPFDLKNMVAVLGSFQSDTKGADTATAQFNEQSEGYFFFVFEMFPHQLNRPGGHLKHAILSPAWRLSLFK